MNAIDSIQPYRFLDMWVFDDPRVGLSAEPFVGGADTMIELATSQIPDAKQYRLEWRRAESSGNVYFLRNSTSKDGDVLHFCVTSMKDRENFTYR